MEHHSDINSNINLNDQLETIETTSIFHTVQPNLFLFFSSFMDTISMNSNDESEFIKNIKKINFDNELQIDLESVEKGMLGKIFHVNLNIKEKNNYMFLLNKALFYQSFQCQNQEMQEITLKVTYIFKTLSYHSEYN